ncbi:MAG: hypothetical protein ACRYGG_23255, partial [Janthinobacterium lividum]
MACFQNIQGNVTLAANYEQRGHANAEDIQSCCMVGSKYLSHNICLSPTAPAGQTGYYMAGCTDPTFKNPACSPQCCMYTPKPPLRPFPDTPSAAQLVPDIVYNPDAKKWACCGGKPSRATCFAPAGASFEAPSPEVLDATAATSKTPSLLQNSKTTTPTPFATLNPSFVTLASVSTSTPTRAPAKAASASASSTASPTPMSDLGAGNIVAISIAAVCGVSFLICALIYTYIKRHPKSPKVHAKSSSDQILSPFDDTF